VGTSKMHSRIVLEAMAVVWRIRFSKPARRKKGMPKETQRREDSKVNAK
jgi:hypothetical protein